MFSLRKLAAGTVLAATAAASILARQYVAPGPVEGDTFIHDPTVVKTPGGEYLAVFTADNVGLKRSADRVTWTDAGVAFPDGAPWTEPWAGDGLNLWAPDVSYHNGQYYLYYSASTFSSRKSATFLATSATGEAGDWTNQGVVVETEESSEYNAIDGNLVVDAQGRWWLAFGSHWGGLKLVRLDPETGKRLDDDMFSIAARPSVPDGPVEAPYIIEHDGWYYLWVSFDRCCAGTDSTYRIMVGRSQDITGPYLDKEGTDMMQGGGTQVLASHGQVHGPGHNSVLRDTDGDVLFYHYYNAQGVAQIGINLIRYENGWPVVY